MTNKELFDLMATHHAHTAKLQFYDMADRYILTINDWHLNLNQSVAEDLIEQLKTETSAVITSKNGYPAIKLTQISSS
ncbi:phosphate acetyltransferase [Leuconostoc rapi]|uniref:phosphate acetyltransferase n=1 Tax=Leuconostoc rapi TaxID=1406906 RepID=UPI001EF79E8B|nr:phosphate acetyltransferase [Leuconostoc rapi]MBM7434846.1 sulfur carrier protein ThiS [Leuconostoc rapi]